MKLDPDKRKLQAVLAVRKDRRLFFSKCLKIRAKDNKICPLVLNVPQEYVDARLDEQLEKTGRVRALVLKGRQQGVSTYVGARYYHKASLGKGVNVFIMAHEQAASDNLFKIVDRYHSHNPLKPHTGVSNVKELEFDRLDSSYAVGTAGAKAGGRSKTITLYHGSEVAFWKSAADHFAASVQAVPDVPGTEIILESTANGVTGEFYERWQDAVAERSDYIAVFVPWFWSPEYSRPDLVTEDFELETHADDGELSESEYAEMFGLDRAQMAWRRNKIAELRSVKLFKQEYPATAEEAFQSSQDGSFIDGNSVLRARKRQDTRGAGPLVFGVDPAGSGGDRFAVCMRRGHVVEKLIWRDKIKANEAHTWLKSLIDEYKPARVFIDAGGLGGPVVDFLRAEGPHYSRIIRAVNFGSTSQAKQAKPKMPGPRYRRDEMWDRVRAWLESDEMVSLPDMDALQSDLTGPQQKANASNDTVLESKSDMRARGIRSPDLGDAVALTFASLQHIKDWEEAEQGVSPSAGTPERARRWRGRKPSHHGWMR